MQKKRSERRRTKTTGFPSRWFSCAIFSCILFGTFPMLANLLVTKFPSSILLLFVMSQSEKKYLWKDSRRRWYDVDETLFGNFWVSIDYCREKSTYQVSPKILVAVKSNLEDPTWEIESGGFQREPNQYSTIQVYVLASMDFQIMYLGSGGSFQQSNNGLE